MTLPDVKWKAYLKYSLYIRRRLHLGMIGVFAAFALLTSISTDTVALGFSFAAKSTALFCLIGMLPAALLATYHDRQILKTKIEPDGSPFAQAWHENFLEELAEVFPNASRKDLEDLLEQ